jgi:hypothetical protein
LSIEEQLKRGKKKCNAMKKWQEVSWYEIDRKEEQ